MFDSSIGGKSVLMPYGGKYQLSETQSMVAKLPLLDEESDAVTIMSYGFDPYLSSWSPYHGAMYAIVSSLSKIVAAGGDYKKVHFTFQEYFRRMTDSSTWGEPLSALLGAYEAQMKLGLASIGGKDSMSGSFNDINVPPTLVSFAVAVGDNKNIISTELKKVRNKLYLVKLKVALISQLFTFTQHIETSYSLPSLSSKALSSTSTGSAALAWNASWQSPIFFNSSTPSLL